MIRDIPTEKTVWVIAGHRVFELTAWRQLSYDRLIAQVPGAMGLNELLWGYDAFATAVDALRENMRRIDFMRRMYDDLAATNEIALRRAIQAAIDAQIGTKEAKANARLDQSF